MPGRLRAGGQRVQRAAVRVLIDSAGNDLNATVLTNAQGEDVVAGIRMTDEISKLKAEMLAAYKEFEQFSKMLEKHYRDMQDVEFTIVGAIGCSRTARASG